jgi:hypothetical protein
MNSDRSWFKSSYSSDQGNCLEVAHGGGPETAALHIRDSKNPAGPVLTVGPAAWTAFTRRLAARH